MNDLGSSPNASAKRPIASTSPPPEPGELHDEADLGVRAGDAAAEAALVELAVHVGDHVDEGLVGVEAALQHDER